MLLAFQVLGLSLGVIGWCLENSCTSSHSWRAHSHSQAVTTNNWQLEGLWMTCAATSLGSVQCQRYKTVLGLPGYIQACRALMIIALLLGLASIIVSVLGLKCTKIGSTSEQVKVKITLTGGSLFILSGLSTLTAVLWYTARVVQEFHDPFFAGVRGLSYNYSKTSRGQQIYRAAPVSESGSSKAYV
ncbi:claudin-19 isoform X2 [Salmo salar]|uniref:Claudin n=1 Tax=Salmo salar TaxID=8030 RepID=A0A1S3NJL5_SALSA|nr:claudin-19 isoform X2 [Salmo salar]|eukprot:XP_014015450.1 PREDICTED: claudin-1 isoform X2 [Salmo salar]